MQRVSASASRSLPSEDPRRYSYRLESPSEDGNHHIPPTSCNCPLPARPDNWSDLAWRKYLKIMARLPCKPCGWPGGGVPPRPVLPAGPSFVVKKKVAAAASSSKNKNKGRSDEEAHGAAIAPSADAAVSPAGGGLEREMNY